MMLGRTCALSVTLGATIALTSSAAFAGGFASARFGGERGNPTETNPSTLYYNPAGIGMSEGTQLMIDVSTAFRTASYDRPVSAIDDQTPFPDDPEKNARALAANSGQGTLNNIIASPMFGISSDLGLDTPLRLGFAFYVPFGGQAAWDEQSASDEFPGASDGSQRWYAIDGSIRTMALTGGVAYHIEPARLSLGLTGNVYLSSIETLRARNTDGSDDLEAGGNLKEGRSLVKGESTDFGLGAGVLWEVWRRKAWLGASYQSMPNFNGDIEYEGTLQNYLGPAPGNEADIKLTSSLPDVFRLGIRVRPKARYEFRLFGDYTRWSVFENQCLVNSTIEDAAAACAVNDDGSFASTDADTGRVIQNLPRNYTDSFGVRAGFSYWFSADLEMLLGGGYDSNAVPDETIDASLMDMDKFTASLGVDYRFTKWFSGALTATNVFYLERDTSGSDGNNDLRLPSRQPGNQGVYNQNIFLINTNLNFSF
ncbi:hypothetical protein FRD01_05045 [Microvenator marinus]|uniref:Long-chain fatty acid transport protein n=1 Tax=Microvenator marinus TaxID=2600177 RepID=A0A5B8XN56_9DELT|nr:outer membrane protein transport protein [Microvenator marinus]QED26621.1 hypothetical protein FRD01_05045 [Microvenator marinus]